MSESYSRHKTSTTRELPGPLTTPNDVNKALTPKRRTRPTVENHDYAAFTRRVIHAHARRIADGDVEGLPELIALEHELQHAIHTAVTGLHASGYSWTEIATRQGLSRQGAHQRWGLPW